MDTTEDLAKTTEAKPPPPDERARARAYLDRWERELVRAALKGPGRGGNRSPA